MESSIQWRERIDGKGLCPPIHLLMKAIDTKYVLGRSVVLSETNFLLHSSFFFFIVDL